MTEETSVEDVEEFAARARAWLAENMPPADPTAGYFSFHEDPAESEAHANRRIARCRDLQARLFDGGFAGICVPREYGGQGLTPAHQAAFNRELAGYDFPLEIQVSTFIPCMAVLLEFGTEDQKLRHIPPMLRGEEVWAQFLSEPSGGSDAAGALTSAVRDGDQWIVNGSKIWTTGAWYSDWAMCLARTNWEVEKHRGLTVLTFPVRRPGVDVQHIQLLNGSREFCQEFLTDVAVDDRDRVGDVDDGWTVMTRWLYHERTVAGGSPYVTAAGSRTEAQPNDGPKIAALARAVGNLDDPATLERIGEAKALSLVGDAMVQSVSRKMADGTLPQHAAAMLRLFSGTATTRKATIALEVGGEQGVVWTPGDEHWASVGLGFLVRQASQIGGGTTEMARNVVSERLLGMRRDQRSDGGPFRDVPKGPT
jgi:alkylation response protein AidB-like acyl-CoA dehydrogenase